MRSFNKTYLYTSSFIQQYEQLIADIPERERKVEITHVENGIILPTLETKAKAWGFGGVLDSKDCFVEQSRVGTAEFGAFGGKYPYDYKQLEQVDEVVYFVGCAKNHWGHFLIDFLSRFWFIDGQTNNYRIAFCGSGWQNGQISGNYMKLLEYLGIDKKRMLYVNHPMKFNTVLIPDPAMSYGLRYDSNAFKNTIQIILKAALKDAEKCNLRAKDKVYFTRVNFADGKKTDIGEVELQKMFSDNGYEIMSPESMTLTEQIFYIHNCKYMASMSGTIPHNAIFMTGGEGRSLLS